MSLTARCLTDQLAPARHILSSSPSAAFLRLGPWGTPQVNAKPCSSESTTLAPRMRLEGVSPMRWRCIGGCNVSPSRVDVVRGGRRGRDGEVSGGVGSGVTWYGVGRPGRRCRYRDATGPGKAEETSLARARDAEITFRPSSADSNFSPSHPPLAFLITRHFTLRKIRSCLAVSSSRDPQSKVSLDLPIPSPQADIVRRLTRSHSPLGDPLPQASARTT